MVAGTAAGFHSSSLEYYIHSINQSYYLKQLICQSLLLVDTGGGAVVAGTAAGFHSSSPEYYIQYISKSVYQSITSLFPINLSVFVTGGHGWWNSGSRHCSWLPPILARVLYTESINHITSVN